MNTESNQYGAAMIGLGWWGTVLLDACSGGSALRFVHGVTKDIEAAAGLAAKYCLRVTDDISHALADDDVDVVVLATPHSLHVEQVIACAAAGKSVFTEKPLALDLDGARRAVEACEKSGVVLGLGTDKRFLPGVVALKELVVSGLLGTVLHLEAQYSNDNSLKGFLQGWRASSAEAPGAGMTGPGLHALDAIVNLGGSVATVRAQWFEHAPMPAAVDAVAVLLQMASGATGVVTTVRGIPECFRIQVAGTKGWAELRDLGLVTVSLLDGTRTEISYDSNLATGYLLGQFASAVAGRQPFPVSTDSMLATVAAFEATIASLEQNRTVEVTPT